MTDLCLAAGIRVAEQFSAGTIALLVGLLVLSALAGFIAGFVWSREP